VVPKPTRREPRKLPRQTRSKETVNSIVTAAARVLVRDGYEQANVNSIAKLAGVSIGSLYQYYPSKEALVAEVIKRHAEEMLEVFQRGLADLAFLPMPAACRGVVRRALSAYGVNPALRRVINRDVPGHPAFSRSRDFDEMLATALRAYLAFHQALVRPQNLDLAVTILTSAVEAVVVRVVAQDPALLETELLVDELTTLILGYVAKPNAAGTP
jgi:AcrR family transcriptional regulator